MSIWGVNGGIGLGIGVDGKPLPYVGDRHICLIGPNGTGKTKRLLIPVPRRKYGLDGRSGRHKRGALRNDDEASSAYEPHYPP